MEKREPALDMAACLDRRPAFFGALLRFVPTKRSVGPSSQTVEAGCLDCLLPCSRSGIRLGTVGLRQSLRDETRCGCARDRGHAVR